MEYRAIYSGESLSHGRFKYIDKWRSRSGKWVYKYADDLKDKAAGLLDPLKDFKDDADARAFYEAYSEERKHAASNGKERGRTHHWHDTSKDNELSKQARYTATLRGDNQTRTRVVTNANGQRVSRREYRNEEEVKNLNKQNRFYTSLYKSNFGPLGKFLIDFNDKYGPKKIQKLEGTTDYTIKGERYVEYRLVNVIGGRAVKFESYSYWPEEDKVLRQKKNIRRPNRKARK